MRRHEWTDEQWKIIEPLLPRNCHRGKQWKDHRTVLKGILWRVCTRAPWRDLLKRYCHWQTVYSRFNRWRKDGTREWILQALQNCLDKEGLIDWELLCMDGTNILSTLAAVGAGKKGDQQNLPTTHWVAHSADGEANSTWLLTGKASPLPSKLLLDKCTNQPSLRRSSVWRGQELGDTMHLCTHIYPHHINFGGMFLAKLRRLGLSKTLGRSS